MKKYIRNLIPVLLVLSLVLAACGGGATQAPTQAPAVETQAPAATEPVATEPPATEAPTAAATEPPAAETTAPTTAPQASAGTCDPAAQGQSIEMWSPLTGPDGDEMSALADRFSSENTYGIKVTHVAQPDYVVKLETAAAASGLPAMTVVRAINVGYLAERNVLKPMTPELMAVLGPDVGSDFPDQLWSVGEYKGKRYSFPLDTHALVMYYNKDMFKAAGVAEPGPTPWTKAEFEDAIAKLEASGVKPIAIGTAFQAATLFQSLIVQFGGSLADPEGTKATYNSDAAVQALEYIKNLRDKYSSDVSGAGDPEANVYKQGQAAIMIHGPWHISDIQKLPFAGFAPFPQIGDKPAVWAGSHQLGLTSDDPAQQAAAMCWIDWLSRNSMEWAKAGQIPARTSVREDPKLAEVAAPIASVIANAQHAVMLPQVAGLEGALWDQFGPVVDAYLMGETTDLKTALDEAAARSQQTMDENAAQYK